MSSRPRRIVATIGTMGAGGAERVLSLLANGWAARGDRVTLITLDDAPSFYALHESVERLGLGMTGASRGPLRRVYAVARRASALRAAVAKARPDVCLTFIDRHNVLVLVATRGLGVPVVVSERIHPGHLDPPGWSMMRQLAYRSADAIVAQTERTAGVLRSWGGPPVHVIANPVQDPGPVEGGGGARRFLAAGRLVHQKGFDLLLEAFARLVAPGWSLHIHGDGPDRRALEVRARRLGIAERVVFHGATSALAQSMAQADVFVLSSRFEGFPNVLCEAMALGLPCVATRCPTGPEELVQDGVDGLLVPTEDARALSEAMARLAGDAALARRLGQAARGIRERLALPVVLARWDAVFDAAGART